MGARFTSAAGYWERRYATGGNSGRGSYGHLARYKADFLDSFVEWHQIDTVSEFGCGDGARFALARYPDYVGFDVSATAVNWWNDFPATGQSASPSPLTMLANVQT